MPAADNASVVLVTTSTLAGAAAAALGRADAVVGSTSAKLNRARPALLLLIALLWTASDLCAADVRTARPPLTQHRPQPGVPCPLIRVPGECLMTKSPESSLIVSTFT